MGGNWEDQIIVNPLLREFEGTKPHRGRPARNESDRLLGNILWTTWILAEGSEANLKERYVLRKRTKYDPLAMRADEFYAFRQGQRSMSPARLELLALKHATIKEVLQWPLDLLSLPTKLPVKLNKNVRQYIKQEDVDKLSGIYFNGARKLAEFLDEALLYPWDPLNKLYQRGDAYGFFVLVISYYEFYIQRRPDNQWEAACWMIRALPGFCRDPRVQPHAGIVISLIKKLLELLPEISLPITIDENIL